MILVGYKIGKQLYAGDQGPPRKTVSRPAAGRHQSP